MAEAVLGLSAYYHDSAAAIIVDGEIVAAAHEERFTRKKHDSSFPENAARYVLSEAGFKPGDIETVAFYDKPYLKFERLLETYHGFAPKGLKSFISAIPVWIKEKLFMKKLLKDELLKIGQCKPCLLFPEHHLSHAASAFFPSPFEHAAILTLDGVGEWATSTIGFGAENNIEILKQLDFPHSLGLFYSAFTSYCGFRVNSGEYKLMGLAPYGHADSEQTKKFKEKIMDQLIDIRPDGSLLLNMEYFNFATGLTMCCNDKWSQLFDLPSRKPESKLTQSFMNLALATQQVTEEVVFMMAETARKLTGCPYLVMAGGVALNCVANGKLLEKEIFKDIWIQPASGDAGGALGAAFAAWHIEKNNQRKITHGHDSMKGSYLGPEFGNPEITRTARKYNAPYHPYPDLKVLCRDVSELLSKGCVVGWFQGRMEYGPRALGNRSILGNPCDPEMQKKLNLKIKYREGFRPFAPAVLEADMEEYFKLGRSSPYMLLVAPVQENHLNPLPENYDKMGMYERLYHQRSDIPAVTHIDYSARIQSITKTANPEFWELITAFKQKTGFSLLVNTSFNVRGEPIVCTPDDAYQCFMRTEMDYLVIGPFLFKKEDQPTWKKNDNWQDEFQLD